MHPRLLFINIINNYSGSPRVLRDLIFSLSKDQDYLLLTASGPGFLDEIPNRKIFSYSWHNDKLVTLLRFIYAQAYIFFFVLIRTRRNDVVFINTMLPGSAAVAAKMRGLKIVYHIHEFHGSQKYFGKLYYGIRLWVKPIEIFVSKFVAEKETIIPERSFIIYNPISDEFLQNAAGHTYRPLINSNFKVLMICSLKAYKGIYELLKLARAFEDSPLVVFELVLDAEMSEVDEFLGDSSIPSNLALRNRTTDPSQYYKQASLLLSLSRPDEWVETFGLTIVEAMAFGIPCIVPPVGGPLEIVDDGLNGFHISCYEHELLVAKVAELARNSRLCSELSRRAVEKSKLFEKRNFEREIQLFLNNNIPE